MTRRRDNAPAEIPTPDPPEIAPAELASPPVDATALQTVLRSQGVPKSAWPGTLAKMVDRVKAELVATLRDDRATSATRKAFGAWRQDRAQKIRKAGG